jgi:hypothetical protein
MTTLPPIIRIDDPQDPRTAPFRDVRQHDLVGRDDMFIAEGEVVLRDLHCRDSLYRKVIRATIEDGELEMFARPVIRVPSRPVNPGRSTDCRPSHSPAPGSPRRPFWSF